MGNNEQTAIRLLKDLVDFQNGAPLERDKEEYDKLMNEIYAFIDSHSPVSEHSSATEIIESEYRDGAFIDTLQEGDWFEGTEKEYRKVLALELLPKHRFITSMIPAVDMQLSIIESDIDLYSSSLLKHGYCIFIEGSLTWDENKLKKTKLTAPEFIRRAENTFKPTPPKLKYITDGQDPH